MTARERANRQTVETDWETDMEKFRDDDSFVARIDQMQSSIPGLEIDANYLPYVEAAEQMSLILQHAKNMTCAFYVMTETYLSRLTYPQLTTDNRGHHLTASDWYVIVTCANGYKYYVNVTCDSVITMCAEVFGFIQNK